MIPHSTCDLVISKGYEKHIHSTGKHTQHHVQWRILVVQDIPYLSSLVHMQLQYKFFTSYNMFLIDRNEQIVLIVV